MKGCKRCGVCCTVLVTHFPAIGFSDKWIEGRGGWRVGMDVFLPSKCKWLMKDNSCEIHNDKPEYCKNWPESMGPQAWLRNLGCKYYD